MNILVIQNRMGIGDMVIFLPFVEAISKKYNSPVTLLIKESTKANQYVDNLKYIKEIIYLKRDNKNNQHNGLFGFFKLKNEIKERLFDKVFIFNSSLRYRLICRIAGIKNIYQYPLFEKKGQHVIEAAQKLLKRINLEVESNPQIVISESSIKLAAQRLSISQSKVNILLGIGGSGPTKRIPADKFKKLIDFAIKDYDCVFYLATGKNEEEQLILKSIISSYKEICVSLDNNLISEILPIIKNCKISICNDSSFSHLSAALNIPTIVLMSDTPLLYGSYSPNMYPIIPDGMNDVSHNSRGKEKINPEKIYEKFKSIIS
jgi:heptosyltransferase-2